MQHINTVAISGNLTRDPELRSTQGGTSVCSLRVACNGRRKDGTGNWVDDPNFFDVTVWGAQGENAARYLFKGSRVMLQGRLNWREWETQEGGKRQTVEIVAERVQFPPAPDGQGQPQQQPQAQQGYPQGQQPQAQPQQGYAPPPVQQPPAQQPQQAPAQQPATSDLPPPDMGGMPPAGETPPSDDDIPF